MKNFFLLLTLAAFLTTNAQEELPPVSANGIKFFVPAETIEKYKLKSANDDEWMKTYNSKENNAAVQRLVDIRWEAKTKAEAQEWFNANKKLLGEGGDDITSQLIQPAGTDGWKVYTTSKENKKLFEAMGVKQNQYSFTFTVDRYVAKIFIATDEHQSLSDAWELGAEGLRAVLQAVAK